MNLVLFLNLLSFVVAQPSLQVDLLLPQPDTTYLPTYPFPLLFALHNFSSLWPLRPSLTWRLTPTSSRYPSEDGWVGWHKGLSPLTADKVLYINASHLIGTQPKAEWTLEYYFSVGSEGCRGTLTKERDAPYPGARGKITFKTDKDKGELPMVAAGMCGKPIGAVDVVGSNATDSSCPPLANPNPKGDQCAYRATMADNKLVVEEMTRLNNCTNGTWPAGTTTGEKCAKAANKTGASSGTTMRSVSNALPWAFAVTFMMLLV